MDMSQRPAPSQSNDPPEPATIPPWHLISADPVFRLALAYTFRILAGDRSAVGLGLTYLEWRRLIGHVPSLAEIKVWEAEHCLDRDAADYFASEVLFAVEHLTRGAVMAPSKPEILHGP